MFSTQESKKPYVARIKFTLSAALRSDCEVEDFLQLISGRILVQFDDDGREQSAGYVSASLVQFGHALGRGIDADRLGDGISGDVAEYWEQLFDVSTGRWKEEIQDTFEIAATDLLVIDCIELYPRFRGKGIGLTAVERTTDIFGSGCGLVACKPWPLQLTPAFSTNRRRLQRLKAPTNDAEEAVRKLRLYWSRAGFRPVGREGIYAMSMALRSG